MPSMRRKWGFTSLGRVSRKVGKAGCSGERRETKGGSLVVATNVVLLAAVMALLLVGLATKPAFAHFNGYDSVNGNLRMPIKSNSNNYGYAVSHAIVQWNALDRVHLFTSDNPTVIVSESCCGPSEFPNRVGVYVNRSLSVDDIIFFRNRIEDKFNWNAEDVRWLGIHEFGHAVGLKHSDCSVSQNNSVMFSYHNKGEPPFNYQSHDTSDYRDLWTGDIPRNPC